MSREGGLSGRFYSVTKSMQNELTWTKGPSAIVQLGSYLWTGSFLNELS